MPSSLLQVVNNCKKLVDIIRLVAMLFQQVGCSHDITILLQLCVVKLVTFLLYNIIVNSVSFVSTGTFNHVFPSLPMNTLLSSKFPSLSMQGKIRRQRAVPHRKSSAQLWTVSDNTVPYTFEQSLCQLLFPNLEHFNCGRKFRL